MRMVTVKRSPIKSSHIHIELISAPAVLLCAEGGVVSWPRPGRGGVMPCFLFCNALYWSKHTLFYTLLVLAQFVFAN